MPILLVDCPYTLSAAGASGGCCPAMLNELPRGLNVPESPHRWKARLEISCR
jgi:hypothetical protein